MSASWSMKSKKGSRYRSASAGPSRRSWRELGKAPDGDMFLDADSGNDQPVHVEYEHALSGPQAFDLRAGAAAHGTIRSCPADGS